MSISLIEPSPLLPQLAIHHSSIWVFPSFIKFLFTWKTYCLKIIAPKRYGNFNIVKKFNILQLKGGDLGVWVSTEIQFYFPAPTGGVTTFLDPVRYNAQTYLHCLVQLALSHHDLMALCSNRNVNTGPTLLIYCFLLSRSFKSFEDMKFIESHIAKTYGSV